jgi:hypothetical protein
LSQFLAQHPQFVLLNALLLLPLLCQRPRLGGVERFVRIELLL